MGRTINELLKDNSFVYNSKVSPQSNYLTFQQAISFSHGVEFLKTSNFTNKPLLVLLKVPVLSINLNDAEMTLKSFNQRLLNQLSIFIDKSNNQFEIFMHYYELYRAVLIQQEEYRDSKDKFFATAEAIQFDGKDLKDLKLPFIQTYYKSVFHDRFRTVPEPIHFDNIGTEGKRHLEKLYLLKRRYNMKLITELETLKKKLFREKVFTNYYKYTGDIADLLEVALGLAKSGNLKCLNDGGLNDAQFSKDFSLFLGRTFSTVLANKSTIDKRLIRKESFLHKSIKALSKG